MSTKKEVRCPDCGALYNIEECNPATHAAINGRRAERGDIVRDMREKANSLKGGLDREAQAGREALLEYADWLEKKV
jgi:hypothetical protein